MELLRNTLAAISRQDQAARRLAQERLEQLIMPHWALGRLMDLALDLAGIGGGITPTVKRKLILVMAADHGVAATGVSRFGQEVTVQMVQSYFAGVAGCNVLARQAGAKIAVVDMGIAGELTGVAADLVIKRKVARGTADFTRGPAMTREQAIQALEAGIEVTRAFADEVDLFGTAEMGIGNTTSSSAIVAALCRLSAAAATGRGSGLNDEQMERKIAIVEQGLAVNQPAADDPLDVLAKVGGFEIAGIAGQILGAAALRKPIVVDGFISTAGALVAAKLAPACTDFMITSHRSMERGHLAALAELGKEPLLDLNFRLGEGTGAAMAMNLVEGAVAILTEMATFAEAAVSQAAR